jgi:outer membrane protein OmpA-like peptidoglycan-associated protein
MLPILYKPLFLIALLCFCFPAKQFAQKNLATENGSRRNPAIGLHYGIANFSHSPFDAGAINHGYALSFLDGIAGKYDYMVQAGSISPRYPLGKEQNDNRDLLHFINIYGMRRFFSDTVFINPFLGAGPGMVLYKKNLHACLTAAAGFQLRISTSIFLHTQFSYQVNLSSAINNNLAASIGLLGTILQRKKKNKPIWINHALPAQQKPVDTDGDGIIDSADACPTVPGPRTFHGCPDTDGDGIPDNNDSCVTVPGISAYFGCPPPTVKAPVPTIKVDTLTKAKPVIHDSISNVMNELARQIYFETDKATLTPASVQALTSIVNLLKMQPFTQLQIEGHTDNTGTEKRNAQLSEERAKTVLEYLVNGGIDRQKLTAKGFGATRPVADNATPEGRTKNRRTVFALYK